MKNGQHELHVFIDSPGGSIFDGLRIIRMLSDSGLYTTCEVQGLAASMAAAILESSACNVRVVHPYSVLMFHEGSVAVMGGLRQNDAEAFSTALRAMNRALASVIAPRLGLSLDDYLARTTGGRQMWIAGIDAVEQHAADAMVGQQAEQQAL